jgi:hypothetical protein
MDKELEDFLRRLPRANITNIMHEALDYMQQYNGRNISECVLYALGGTEDEQGNYIFPTLTEARIDSND